MVKVVLASVAIMLGAAACSSTAPPAAAARLVGELHRAVRRHGRLPGGEAGRRVRRFPRPTYPQDGVAVIAFTPANTAGRLDLYRPSMAGSGSQVIWRRPGNVGGLDWLDGEARSRADAAAIPDHGAFSTAAQAAGSLGR